MLLRRAGVCLQEYQVSLYRKNIYCFIEIFSAIKMLDQILPILLNYHYEIQL